MSETIPAMRVIYEGALVTVTYDPAETDGEVSIAGEHEQERMILSAEGWADLAEAVSRLGRTALGDAPAVRR